MTADRQVDDLSRQINEALRGVAADIDAAVMSVPTSSGLQWIAHDIDTTESTSSTTFVDLATVGPFVTIATGTNVLVMVSVTAYRASAGFSAYVGIDVSGATTIAAADVVSAASPGGSYGVLLVRTYLITGLTPGSNTFALKYRCDGGGPWYFFNRSIAVFT